MAIVDQYTDPNHQMLLEIQREYPDEIQLVKHASVGSDAPTPGRHGYAYPEAARFPIHTVEDTILSRLYAEKQAHLLPPHVIARLDDALNAYGGRLELATKVAADNEHEDTSQYLLPQYKAIMVKEASDVDGAAEALLANRHKLATATMVEASTKLVKLAADMGLGVQDLHPEIFKYAGMTACDAGVLLDWVEARAAVSPTTAHRDAYTKVAQVIVSKFPATGVISDRDELIKIAGFLEKMDEEAELTPRYNKTLLDPLETVFNMSKLSGRELILAGHPVDEDRLAQLASETKIFDDVLGDEWTAHAKGPDGDIDPEMIAQIIKTLPGDMQATLYTHIKSFL